ncbi:MAG: hypothetical protein ACOVOL_06620, partial [Bacteroidia bacterium]
SRTIPTHVGTLDHLIQDFLLTFLNGRCPSGSTEGRSLSRARHQNYPLLEFLEGGLEPSRRMSGIYRGPAYLLILKNCAQKNQIFT